MSGGFRYPSRAAWKLVELQETHHVFTKKAKTCVDLCAFPGGWSVVAGELLARAHPSLGGCCVVAVDVQPVPTALHPLIRPVVSNVNKKAVQRRIRTQLERVGAAGPDVVLHDGVGIVKGDAPRLHAQNNMAVGALRLALQLNEPRRYPEFVFVTKLVASSYYNDVLDVCRSAFRDVVACQPKHSDGPGSRENYIVCRGATHARLPNAAFCLPPGAHEREGLIDWFCSGCFEWRFEARCPYCRP
jgi:AdoMet-dependent rRNA methyltransferase SPB1